MIQSINNNIQPIKYNKYNPQKSFKGTGDALLKASEIFIKSQENLSSTRFIQDTATNWAPKAVFARSKADFAEMSFLEFLESAIFYFMIPVFGEKVFRNGLFKKFQPKNLQKAVNGQLANSVKEITSNNALTKEIQRRSIATKAGILLACAMVPVAEYTLSFAKNLFTLKAFNKTNFNSIANLDKGKSEKENKAHQEKVEKSAKKHLIQGAVIAGAGIVAGSLLAINGHKSDRLQKVAKNILNPGEVISNVTKKAGVKNEKVLNFLKKFSLDFASDNGKLALSKGQLGLTATVGLLGYSKAAGDRGKLDKQEVWTRVPLVVLYTTFGSELLEKGFINLLSKKNKFPNLLQKGIDGKITVPASKELPEIAERIAKANKTNVKDELSKLTKQKAFVGLVPYLFSIVAMGFTLSAITRIWTQHRYNVEHKDKKNTSAIKVQSFNEAPKLNVKSANSFKKSEKLS
ncbi:hypothetical protein IKQ26_03660 [bacterium]|nr:hypothetical protein [bacterium]